MPSAGTTQCVEKLLALKKKDLTYFQFLLEGYEGLVTVSTIDKKKAVVKLFVMPDFASDIDKILRALKDEIDLEESDE
ncbi:MAG: DUF4911 domain-containing protein [Syntrophales bacterium]